MASSPAPNRILKSAPVRRRATESGTALVEFVLCIGLLIVPLFFGIITLGLSLVLANQVTEVCRDTGHMYAYGVDFSQSSSQTLVTSQLAQGLGVTNTGGRGIIYLSTITYVDDSICIGAGLQANGTSCPNINQYVVTKRITIGNTTVHASAYAPSITPSIIQSSGSINRSDYLKDSSVRAGSFGNVITLAGGQTTSVSEMFVHPPAGGLWALFSSSVVASRSIF